MSLFDKRHNIWVDRGKSSESCLYEKDLWEMFILNQFEEDHFYATLISDFFFSSVPLIGEISSWFSLR